MIIQCHCQKPLPIILILKHICQIFCFRTDEGWNLLKQSTSPASHQGCRYFQGSSIGPSASPSLVSAVDSLALSCLNETPPSFCPQSRSQDKYLHLSHFSASVLRSLKLSLGYEVYVFRLKYQKHFSFSHLCWKATTLRRRVGRQLNLPMQMNQIPCTQSYKEDHEELKGQPSHWDRSMIQRARIGKELLSWVATEYEF